MKYFTKAAERHQESKKNLAKQAEQEYWLN